MAVDYNAISKIYDKVRSENKSILDLFIEEVKITNTTTILDAARENYTNMLQRLTQAKAYGVEPSEV